MLPAKSSCQGSRLLRPMGARGFALGQHIDDSKFSAFSLKLSDEQREFQQLARKFAREEMIQREKHFDQTMAYPQEVVEKAWELGLVNTHVPEKFGGLGLGSLDGCIIGEELAYGCTDMATTMEANGLATAPLLVAGTDAQNSKYLGRLVEEPVGGLYDPALGPMDFTMITRAT
ncbi:hypothetical protein PR003_g7096 [Phytophthora rubi]|uniref:Acyl-CoA dehydrogenase/oxidase N-terminal domain-containing protein n=1 Tax=Phytophthora rubi TaxID=129364 RepID=A0A6A3NPA0_9STRA|nr:hypothetical protein PR002_g2435 [Phytophthora rubi]KAE9050475.1 hypothetical protein PR001_g2347 [Phytophthora rubi]KAE9347085.1 hypothetical protein PR003_g7096 [Phytophthora rubi]